MKIALLCAEDFSLGVASLTAYLKAKGHDVKVIFDPRQFNKSYLQIKFLEKAFDQKDLILKEILEFRPDLIGFSVFTSSYQWAISLARLIKKNMPTPLIFGGIHPTLVPEVVINEDVVDMVCIGEGEAPLDELLGTIKNINYCIKNIWFKKGKTVVKNQIRPLIEDLDTLPFPDRGSLYKQLPRSYSKHPIILTSLGCPYRCIYCANNAIAEVYKDKGTYLRRRSPGHVIDELVQIKKQYMPKYIFFMDDLFTFDQAWLKKFATEYAQKINIPYSCLTHAKFLNEETCRLLKISKCNIVLLGLQSGSESIRKDVLHRYETNDDYLNAVKLLKEFRLKFSLDNILNLPYDSEESILESLNFYNELRPDIIHSFDLVYFPKTGIINKGIEAGLLSAPDITAINDGLYQNYMSAQLSSKGHYRKYALLFTIIPLLPYSMIRKILNDRKKIFLFSKLPSFIVLIVKFILNIKAGTSFIFFSVLKNEFYYIRRIICKRLALW